MYRKTWMKCLMVFLWILIWQLAALWVDNSILLVTPWEVVLRLGELLTESIFWQTVLYSLLRMTAGFCLGFVAAVLLAALSFRCQAAELFLQPFMNLIKTVPVASFVVLFLIWWGSSVLAVTISFLVVLPNIYISTLEGLKATDPQLLEMAKVFRLGVGKKFLFIYRPALRPFLNGAMKLALGMCWKSGVAAEVIGTPAFSVGGEIYLSKIHLDTAGVLAWTGVVVCLSQCLEKAVFKLAEIFFEWIPEQKSYSKGKEKKEMQGSLLTVRHMSKTYGNRKIWEDFSAVYEPGNVYYLTHPSGSGKTTLFRLLCGLEKPDCGAMEGIKRFSMVFQENRLCEEYNAIENVAMVTGDAVKAIEALERVLSGEDLEKPCSQLSGGMKRRVALVRAMEADSDMVLLDEPFTGMDGETRQRAEAYIRERQAGRPILIASHI